MKKNILVLSILILLTSSASRAAGSKDSNCGPKIDHIGSVASKVTEGGPTRPAPPPPKHIGKPMPPPITPVEAAQRLNKLSGLFGNYSAAVVVPLRSMNIQTASKVLANNPAIQRFVLQETNTIEAILLKIKANPQLKTVFSVDGFDSRLRTDVDLLLKALKTNNGRDLVQAQAFRVQFRKFARTLQAVNLGGQPIRKLTTKQVEALVNGAFAQANIRLAIYNVSELIRKFHGDKQVLAQALAGSGDFRILVEFLYPSTVPVPIYVDPTLWNDDLFIEVPVYDPTLDPDLAIPIDPVISEDPNPVIDPVEPPPLPEEPVVVDPVEPPTDPVVTDPPVEPPTDPVVVDPPAPPPPPEEPVVVDPPPAPPPAEEPVVVDPPPAPAPEPAVEPAPAPEPAPEPAPAPEPPAPEPAPADPPSDS